MKIKKGILLVNLGTPNSTKTKDVRKYLREFLMDPRVIDLPTLNRWLLVNGIIAPFRARTSALEYRKLFDHRGAPLKYHTKDLSEALQKSLEQTNQGITYIVKFAMRYQNPSIKHVLTEFKNINLSDLHIIPLFPQYASATTGSVIERAMKIIRKWEIMPSIKFTSNFFYRTFFSELVASQAKTWMKDTTYDHFIFSFHGLPERHILKSSFQNHCQLGSCCYAVHQKNLFCYRAQCFDTARQVAHHLNIETKHYTVCFQSRLGKDPWIKPYIDDTLDELIEKGVKNVLVFSPSFVADCLETCIEIGETYKKKFINKGGKRWDLVQGLNSSQKWVEELKKIILS